MSEPEQTQATTPPPLTPYGSERYHFIMVATEGGAPVQLSSNDIEALKQLALAEMAKAGQGWCYFVIDGAMCALSQPKQIFHLRLPDGSFSELRGVEGPVFDSSGRFTMLRSEQPQPDQ
jgi:hypothetical protein